MGRSGDSHNPGPSVGVTAQGHALAGDSIVLEEEIDPNYVPTQEEVREYAKWLGMDLEDDRDQDLFWIAKEGLKAPLPENWKPCKTMDTDEIYYFNFVTGESTWDHPCDEYYRKLYEEEKKKKLTKDKAKHDKSKLQAKKDMDQLLGRKKRRKKRPEGKKNAQKRSPKNPEVVSTVLDRKPLPGIKRQLLHNCDTPAYDTWKSDQIKLENARSSRTQLSSLVSHRLSQHLSVSVGSDDHDVAGQMSDDHHESFRDGSLRHSADMGPSYSGEKDSGTREEAMGASKMKSQHADALKELRTKHAREVNEMQQAHDDIRCQLEEKHRRHLDLPKSAWAATAEEQSMKAEEALRCGQEKTRELEKMCERHYSEIDTIERDFIDSNARLEEAKAEREKTRKAADTEKHDVEMAMVELGRNIWSEGGFLQEAKNIDHKDHRGHRGGPKDVSSDKGTGRLEFMRVVSELAIERKRVVELEGRLKVVNANVEATTMTDQGSSPLLLAALECEDNTPNVCIEKFTELEGKLAIALRENEDLRSNVARAEGTVQGDQIGSKGQERSELLYLETALEEANTRFSKLEKAKRLSEMEAEDALTALEAMQEKTANLELINCELSKQIVRSRRAAISDGEDGETQGEKCSSIRLELVETQEKLATMRKTHEEYEAELSHRRRECYELRADSARYPEEVQASKRREAVIRNDLKSTQKTLHETELQNEELKSVLATVRQEKAQNASTAARLRLEDTHIREDTEQIHVTAEEPYYRVHDMEVQKLKTYLAGIEKSRDGLNKEVQDLKQKLLASEGSSRTERATFEAESASQKVTLESDKDHIESLQATIKMLESDMETGERKEEAQSSHYTTQREHKSTSMSQGELQGIISLAPGIAAQTSLASQEKEERRWAVHLRDRNEKPVAAADLGGIVKYESAEEQSSLASRLHHAEEQIGRLQASLQETRRKLVDAQGVNVSTEDISEDNVKGVAPEGAQEELSEVGGDVVKKLMEEERRRVHTEERLEQACDDRLTLETSLWETVDVQHAHGNELGAAHEERVTCAFLEKEYRNTHSQTEIDRITCDLEGKFAWSQEEVERARASIASREMGIIRLVDWTVRENGAMGDAQRSNKLASDRQEEINTLYKRQQGVLGELDKERINLEHAEEECRHANAAAKEAKDKLLDAEKGSYRDMHELRASLQVTSARADRTQEHDRKSLQQTSPSTIYKYKSGGGYSISRDFESSICATSDGTNQGLADELMHKLTDETSRKRSDKTSRSWEKKLEVEKRVLAVARQMMKHHKQRVRRRQQNILQCQARWRDQQHSRSRRPARRRSLEEAKRKLDREVLELNVYVKQLRHNKTWLDRRERKVFDFEQLLRKQKPWSRGRKEQHSGSCFLESSDAITPDWRSLEALQQELDNDLSDVNQGNGVYQSRETLRQKRSQSQQFAASRGKENVCPTSIPPRGRTRYQMFSPFPAAPDFRERRATPSVGKVDQSSGLPRRRTQECRRRSKAHHCRDGLSNNRTLPKNFAVHDLSMSLEAELQQWLNCPEADPRRRSLADRERTMHLTKLKEEGRQAQSTVALHVDWLNSLRQEMGLLGSYGAESSMPTRVRATSVADISPAVDALISPRRVVKASLLGSLQARDV